MDEWEWVSVDLQQKTDTFRENIFLFSLPKIYQRLHKPYKGITRGLEFMRIAQMLPDNGNAGVAILKDVSRIIRWILEHLSSDKESFPTTQIGHLVGGFGYIENLSQQLFESKTWLTDLGDITIDGKFLNSFILSHSSSNHFSQSFLLSNSWKKWPQYQIL